MSAADATKIQKFREHLHQEWTGDRTVTAWRKWHAQIAAFTRGATEAILEAAHLRPGMRVLDLACGVGDPALSIAEEVGPSGRVTVNQHRIPRSQRRVAPLCGRDLRRSHLPLWHHVFSGSPQSVARMSPRPEARWPRRVCRMGQEGTALLYDNRRNHSKACSGAAASSRSRWP